MARKRMISREVTVNNLILLCLDTHTCEPSNIACVIYGKIAEPKKLLEKAREKMETENFKVVEVVSNKEEKVRYGMSVEDFMKHAWRLKEEEIEND